MSVISSFENASDKQQAQKDVIRRIIGRRADYYKEEIVGRERGAQKTKNNGAAGCMLLGHTQKW